MFPELTRDDVFRLETRRLWLRWPRMADASAILRQAGEKAVAEMTATAAVVQLSGAHVKLPLTAPAAQDSLPPDTV